ncbi:type II pantothenate kinase [Paenisporosarcina cavernae]|uniref:Type II pantothenate kinase n=1 Tax=Paenisporosarcina cavernae TaxID=2320858 RepID=A0A385YV44_9BACL|nr:type II pantothenate kinase [Paenisporosarcina cavernae]AYC29432.1 type II pantothenate kinase [Paenisporosarcina cavernae]
MEVSYIGVDAGGTLTKIAYSSTDSDTIHYHYIPSKDTKLILPFLQSFSKQSVITFTGGRAQLLMDELKIDNREHYIIEFDATINGVHFLLQERELAEEPLIVTNIGTGTSIHFTDHKRHKRLGGTGVGGGLLTGMSAFLLPNERFDEVLRRSSTGKREMIDLLVKDIYNSPSTPINPNLTASNFGKIGISTASIPTSNDILAGIIGMIGEVVSTLSVQYAEACSVEKIVYIGSTLENNPMLRETIESYTTLKNKNSIFIDNHGFAGAIGAFLRSKKQ